MKTGPDFVMPIPERPGVNQRFIVAEISKTWVNGNSPTPLLCEQFEMVIEHNRTRGYRLHSFQLHRLIVSRYSDQSDDQMNETIIAVFELRMGTP